METEMKTAEDILNSKISKISEKNTEPFTYFQIMKQECLKAMEEYHSQFSVKEESKKPLSEITDEDLEMLFKIEHNYNATVIRRDVSSTGELWGWYGSNGSIINCGLQIDKLTLKGAQYLQSKNYELPKYY